MRCNVIYPRLSDVEMCCPVVMDPNRRTLFMINIGEWMLKNRFIIMFTRILSASVVTLVMAQSWR